MTKYPAENDVAVLLIFFTRQETLKRTFEAIKKARPSHLYLYQDGPRNEVEAQKIEAAKRIVADEEIDWECEVQRNYHTENSGAWLPTIKHSDGHSPCMTNASSSRMTPPLPCRSSVSVRRCSTAMRMTSVSP